jgi:hypothetical protein
VVSNACGLKIVNTNSGSGNDVLSPDMIVTLMLLREPLIIVLRHRQLAGGCSHTFTSGPAGPTILKFSSHKNPMEFSIIGPVGYPPFCDKPHFRNSCPKSQKSQLRCPAPEEKSSLYSSLMCGQNKIYMELYDIHIYDMYLS